MKRKRPIRNAPTRGKRGRPPQNIVAKRESEERQQEVVRKEAILQLASALVMDSMRLHHDTHETRNRLRWALPGLVHVNDTALDDWIKSWNLQPQKELVSTVKSSVIRS